MAILVSSQNNFNYCWSTSHFDTFNINVYAQIGKQIWPWRQKGQMST